MRKVLFLDVDGVLNTPLTKERCDGFIGVDPALAKRLTDWLKANPDVEVVLSSTWRNASAFVPNAHRHLWQNGITWVDVTPHLKKARGFEIQAFLAANPDVTAYAILDDLSDMLPDQMTRLVQTNPEHGLQPSNLEQLSNLFN